MISVIIPTLNEAENIEDTIARLEQGDGLEILVVDGGSTDGTPERAARLADRVLSTPAGRAMQMNAGAEAASGEVLWFLHADTRPSADAAGRIARAVGRGAVWGRFDVVLRGQHPGLRVIAWFMNRRSRFTGIATGDQGIFVTREAFAAVGGFPRIALMEDVAISRHLRRLAWPCCLRGPLSTSGRRWEANGLVRTVLLMWRLRLAFFLGADPAMLHRRYTGEKGE